MRDRAISPVIGVILMVSITVILAAVMAALVFGTLGAVRPYPSGTVFLKSFGTDRLVIENGTGQIVPKDMVYVQFVNNGTLIGVPIEELFGNDRILSLEVGACYELPSWNGTRCPPGLGGY